MLKVINVIYLRCVIYLQCVIVSWINPFPAFIVLFLHPLQNDRSKCHCTRNHTRKHRTTCNEVKLGNDANNADAELRATCKVWLHYCVARFTAQREGNANNKYFASIIFQTSHAGNAALGL